METRYKKIPQNVVKIGETATLEPSKFSAEADRRNVRLALYWVKESGRVGVSFYVEWNEMRMGSDMTAHRVAIRSMPKQLIPDLIELLRKAEAEGPPKHLT